MGAWGEEPLSNDTAMDLYGDIIAKVEKVANKKSTDSFKSDYDKIRAAALILVRLDVERNYKQEAARLFDKLKVILLDEEWIGDWNTPEAVHTSTADQLTTLGAAYGLK